MMYTVQNLSNDPARPHSLPWAVVQANGNPGNTTIAFAPALTANGPARITLTETLILLGTGGKTTIDGPGANLLTIDGNGRLGLLAVGYQVCAVLLGLTFANGRVDVVGKGGGIGNAGTLTMIGCTLIGNSAPYGGALYNAGALTVIGSTFRDNSATYRGGALENDGTATLTGCVIRNNYGAFGGGIVSFGPLFLGNSFVAGNSAVDIDSENITSLGSNFIGRKPLSGGLWLGSDRFGA